MKTLEDVLETLEKIETIVMQLNNSIGKNLVLHHPCSEEEAHYTIDFVRALHWYLYIDLSVWKDEFTTPAICKKAAQWFGEDAMPYIPEKFLSAELYMLALQRVPHSEHFFKDIPLKFKTPELCLAAVRQDQFELQYVPEPFKTLELCVATIRAIKYVIWEDEEIPAIDFVPPELVEQVLQAVGKACDENA
jgi:hypothetical protein